MRRAWLVAPPLVLLFIHDTGCGGSHACDAIACNNYASFTFACTPAEPVGYELTGECASANTGHLIGMYRNGFDVENTAAGTCHVVVTFASGFTYAADVNFTSSPADPDSCCASNLEIGPTQSVFTIENPRNTCDPAAGFDAGRDAASEVAADGRAEAE
jgi:hypothetical protein